MPSLSNFKQSNTVLKGRPPNLIYEDVVRDQHVDAETKLVVSSEPLRMREPILSDPLFVQVLLADIYGRGSPLGGPRNPQTMEMCRKKANEYLYSHKLYAALTTDTGNPVAYKKGEYHRMVAFYTDAETGALKPLGKDDDQFDVVGHPTVANHWTGLRTTQGVPLTIGGHPQFGVRKTPYAALPGQDTYFTGHLPQGLKFQYQPAYIQCTRDRTINSDGSLGAWENYENWPENLRPEYDPNLHTNPQEEPYIEVVRHPCGVHVNGKAIAHPFYREYTLALMVDSEGSPTLSGRIHGAPQERVDDTFPITCTNKYGNITYNWYVEVDDSTPQFSSRYNAGGGPGYRKQRSITGQAQEFPLTPEGHLDIVLEVGQHMDVAVPQMMEGDYTSEAEVDLQMGMERKVRHFGQTQMWQVYSRSSNAKAWVYDPRGLPAGISMDPYTGVISGTAIECRPRTQYRILARNNVFRVLETTQMKQERILREEQGGERAFVNEHGERVDFRDDGGDACAIFFTVRAVAPVWIGYTYMKAVYAIDSKITPNVPIMHGQPSLYMAAHETNARFSKLVDDGNTPVDEDYQHPISAAKKLPDGLILNAQTGALIGNIITPNNARPIISRDVGEDSPFYESKTKPAVDRYGAFIEEDLSQITNGRSPMVLRSECFHKFYIDALTEVHMDRREEDYLHPLATKIVRDKQSGRTFIRNTTHVYIRVVDAPPLIHSYTNMDPRYRINHAIEPNSPFVVQGQGGEVDEFWCPPESLPLGLVLNKYDGQITGTPTRLTHLFHGAERDPSVCIYAKNTGGSCLIRILITVMDSAPIIAYLVSAQISGNQFVNQEQLAVTQHPQTQLFLTEIKLDVRQRSGGYKQVGLFPRVTDCELTAESTRHFSFTMEGHAPVGLAIDPRTGAITGTVSGQNYHGTTFQTVRIRCTNTAGPSPDFIIKFEINGDGAPVPLPSSISAPRPMKIILLGGPQVGKSTLQRAASEGRSNLGHVRVGGLNSATADSVRPQCTQMRIDHPDGRGGKLHVEIWDAASWLHAPGQPFDGQHPHIRDRPADGAMIMFSAEQQNFPQGDVQRWLQELQQHNGAPCCTMLMLSKIDRLRSQPSAIPAINIDERLARDWNPSGGQAASQLEMTAGQYAYQHQMMFAKTCALDDKNVDKYDNHKGHTVYGAVNAMAQKIYQIKREMDFTPNNYASPAKHGGETIFQQITHTSPPHTQSNGSNKKEKECTIM